jgi:ribonuclease HI
VSPTLGAAAVLTRPGKNHRLLHYHLGNESEYTIYNAELAGLSMGLHLIKTEKKARRGTMIGADNQAAIKAVQNKLSTLSYYIAKDILHTAQQIKKRRGNKSYTLTLHWTAGHEGIDGNELVDEEAKKAAKGQSSPPHTLPRLLRQKLKISTAALKQVHNKEVKTRWKEKWAKSPRGKHDHQINSSSPLVQFIEAISNPKLPRQAASLISQLRTTHIPLNSYLHRFKRVDSTRCQACRAMAEMVQHFLLYCPGYPHERWALEKAIKCKPNMKTLLENQKLALALKNYIYTTHRFDKKPPSNGE